MRVINWIELENFKSFGGRTKITFPDGLNVIIGPNGSGKSNISDAICFVFGRSSKKELRAEKYGEFIFNGGKYGKPADYAKVTISLDNKNKMFPIDSDEIIISRRVDKEGRTTYRVNGERQVMDYVKTILKQGGIDPDGYSIVLQGSILKISDLTPRERRELIESIAGISFYEDRKHKSELELKKVENRIREVKIMLAEKIKYMKELEEEKRNAEKFLGLKRKLEIKKKSLLIKQRLDLEKELDKIEKRVLELNKEKDKLESERDNLERKKEKIEELIEEVNKKIEEMGGKKQIEISNELSKVRSKISNINFMIENYKKEILKMDERKKQLESELGGLNETINLKKKEVDEHEKEIREIDSKISEIEKELKYRRNIVNRLDELKSKLSKIEVNLVRNLELKNKLEEIKSMQDKRKKIIEELSKIKSFTDEIDQKSKELKNKRKELNELLSRRTYLHIKNPMEVLKGVDGVFGRVDDLCKIKDYVRAIDAFAGKKWDWIVVKDVKTAKRCIEKIKEKKVGVYTFIPLDKIEYKEVKKPENVIGRITDFLEYDKKFDTLFKFLFGNVFIVDGIPNNIKNRFVTVNGEVIGNYTITGGYRISRHEAINIENKINKLKKEIVGLESEIEELRVKELKNKKKEYELKAELSRIPEFDLNSYKLILESIENLNSEKSKLEGEMKKIELGDYEEIEKEYSSLNEKKNKILIKINSIRGELNNVLVRDKRKSEEVMRQIEKQKVEFNEDIKRLEIELANLKEKEKILVKEESGFRKELKDLYKKRGELTNDSKRVSEKIVEFTGKINQVIREIQDLVIEKARLSAEIEGLKQNENEYEVEVSEVKESIDKIKEDIRNLEEKISSFGPINLRALDVFNEVKKEYDEIKSKFDRIIGEREEIIKTIEDIDKKKRDVFLNTLHEISKNFNDILNKITGGEGWLETDEEDPFDSGVFLKVKFPGKKILTTRSMSGGEKSIIALALIFALQASNPSPFYFLDEADTALDKLNSERFASILKEYSKEAQIIVISHNDAVMIKADHLYGVSMNSSGISKVVSLELPQ